MHAPLAVQRLFSLLVLAGLLALTAHAAKWPAIDPAEISETKPRIEADAGAEVLLAETEVDDSDPEGPKTSFYARIKVFTEQGVDKLSKIEIPFDRNSSSLAGIEARTIKPDGRILELKRDDIYERETVKAGNLRMRVKSFAPPGLQPGDIIEYRFRLSQDTRRPMFPLHFQGAMPMRSVVYRFKPLKLVPGLNMQMLYMNYPNQAQKPNQRGFYEFALHDVRSRKEERFQPAAVHILSSVLIYYTYEPVKSADQFWAMISARLHRDTRSNAKATKEIVSQVQKLVTPADSPDEKLRRIHDFCRGQIVNRQRDGNGLSKEERRKLKPNGTAAETLKSGSGTATDINTLFVALARAAGFDARLALANDRTIFFYKPGVAVPFTFTRAVAAVQRGDNWTFFDPGASYLPADMIDWRNGDTSIIIASENKALIVPVDSAPAERSVRRQSATLTLDADGLLEGVVTVELTGYFEATEKNSLDAATPEEIKQHLLALVQPHLKSAEITAIRVEHANRALEPIKISFHLRVPEFAERTGSRLFVQPSVFRRGGTALFESETRDNLVLFPHRYLELDEVTITVPEGFAIEAGSAPPGLDIGAVGKYDVEILWNKSKHSVTYHREFQLKNIGYGRTGYPALKRIFEMMHERDNHTLTFRQTKASSPAPTNP
ncbi:MAG: DUF3857 and transglutaminase domain-containing protein [Opitutaceae bacterium]|nr:DUF3857 and transglutaminase domain-containing protein [Opitutaceae bacterium]